MPFKTLIQTLDNCPSPDSLWSEGYKIPWNDPEFSRRMLAEHLSQDHELASRNSATINEQAGWLHRQFLSDHHPARILDLCCGPGLYARPLTAKGHTYQGIDFGPASIEHAKAHAPEGASFTLGDVTSTPMGGPHDLITLLYGELNVFPPERSAELLRRARLALAPGGTLAIEVHTFAAVRASGEGRSWQTFQGGLFSPHPHLVLTDNHWFEDQATAVQGFHVLIPDTNEIASYRSTMRAWSDEEYRTLLIEAGFSAPMLQADWPSGSDQLRLYSARA